MLELATLAGLAFACATGPPRVGWENLARPDAELEADRRACTQQAMAAEFSGSAGRDRAEAAFRGNVFLRCMDERGWHQVLVED